MADHEDSAVSRDGQEPDDDSAPTQEELNDGSAPTQEEPEKVKDCEADEPSLEKSL